MNLIAIASSAPAYTLDATIIILLLIPFIVVGCVVGTFYFLRRRQKRDMQDV